MNARTPARTFNPNPTSVSLLVVALSDSRAISNAPPIPVSHQQIQPDVRDPEVNAGNIIEILDVRLTIEDVQLNAHRTVPREIPQLSPVRHRILQIEIGRPLIQETASSFDVF
jgi:hypothetical protein